MMDIRAQVAQQIGFLMLANIEQAAKIEELQAKLAELTVPAAPAETVKEE